MAREAYLKGQCHGIFDFRLFFMNQFPHALEYPIRAVSNFFSKIAEIFAAQGAPSVSMTLVANRKNFQPEKPAANLPPISLTPVVYLDLRISPRSEKIRNDPNVIFRGLGEDDS